MDKKKKKLSPPLKEVIKVFFFLKNVLTLEKMSDLDDDGLQLQASTQGATPVSYQHETGAAFHTDKHIENIRLKY